MSAEFGQDFSELDIRDQLFLMDYSNRRSKFRVYEMASAFRLSNLPSRTKSGRRYYWEDYEQSVLDLFRPDRPETKKAEVERAWNFLRRTAKRKGW